jgi:hypothetical protein
MKYMGVDCHVSITCSFDKCNVTLSVMEYLGDITVYGVSMYLKMHARWDRMILHFLLCNLCIIRVEHI